MAEMDKRRRALTIPNLLSAFRILLVPVMAALYCGAGNYPLTAGVLLLSGATDVADGYIARRFHMVSDLGKVLDPVADKLTQAAALGCLLTRFPRMAWALLALVVKEVSDALTGYLVIKKTGVVCGAEWHGKAATCVLFAVMVVHVLWFRISPSFSLALTVLATAVQILSMALYLKRNFGLIRSGKPS